MVIPNETFLSSGIFVCHPASILTAKILYTCWLDYTRTTHAATKACSTQRARTDHKGAIGKVK
jgi:hypothetical protein